MLSSPNYSSRGEHPLSLVVIHYTGMQTAEEAIARLCDPVCKVSSHYVVDEQGGVLTLVDEDKCAWHAGVSSWRGFRNVNEISVGIEVVNPGHEWGYVPFPEVQMKAVCKLTKGIVSRYNILPRNVVGHSDVAPQRKSDPGELFDWAWLASQGVGIWPFEERTDTVKPIVKEGDEGHEVLWVQTSLASYGYQVPLTGIFDILTKNVVIAFQRHFRTHDITGVWDSECAARLEKLLQVTGG